MSIYAVERSLAGIDQRGLAAARDAAIDAAARLTATGSPVRYLRSIFLPGEERCTRSFEAGARETVEHLKLEAQLPFERISETLDLAPAR